MNVLREKFSDYGLTFSIGGKISFDVFPNGWDKTFCLRHVADEEFEEIHFFGDSTHKVMVSPVLAGVFITKGNCSCCRAAMTTRFTQTLAPSATR